MPNKQSPLISLLSRHSMLAAPSWRGQVYIIRNSKRCLNLKPASGSVNEVDKNPVIVNCSVNLVCSVRPKPHMQYCGKKKKKRSQWPASNPYFEEITNMHTTIVFASLITIWFKQVDVNHVRLDRPSIHHSLLHCRDPTGPRSHQRLFDRGHTKALFFMRCIVFFFFFFAHCNLYHPSHTFTKTPFNAEAEDIVLF